LHRVDAVQWAVGRPFGVAGSPALSDSRADGWFSRSVATGEEGDRRGQGENGQWGGLSSIHKSSHVVFGFVRGAAVSRLFGWLIAIIERIIGIISTKSIE